MIPSSADWWLDTRELASLFKWLHEHDEISASFDAFVEYLEHPYRWTPEWIAMQADKTQETGT